MPVHAQQVVYKDQRLLEDVLDRLAGLPPLVTPDDIEVARIHHAAASRGEAFLLVGGDCAESFEDTKDDIVAQKMDLLVHQAQHIEHTTGIPVHITARLAGQYAKPRSQLMETLPDGRQVHAFRGHNINGPSISDREPNPEKLLHGWWHSLAVLHKLRSSTYVCLPEYQQHNVNPNRSMTDSKPSSRRPIATAHEALHLPLEAALTKGRYNTSATFLWAGERTRQLAGAHLHYLSGLRNPIGVKIGPTTTPEQVLAILQHLCNDDDGPSTPGRVTLIPRLGADNVSTVLPPIVQAVRDSGFEPVWMCDPCHGNTVALKGGVKTRCVVTMLSEVEQVISVLARHGIGLGGLHLEQTGEEVGECVDTAGCLMRAGGLGAVGEKGYKSLCDPRLSGSQAREFAERVAEMLVVHGAGKKGGVGGQEKRAMVLAPTLLERAVCFFAEPFASVLKGFRS